MKRVWVGTSWKMNKVHAEAEAYIKTLLEAHLQSDAMQLFIIPPFPYLRDVSAWLAGSDILTGAQNTHWEDFGAWTGEVSLPMIRDCGAGLVEIGHSERRANFNETDATVALKVAATLRAGLAALVCVGETRAQYDNGETEEVLTAQVSGALAGLDRSTGGRLLFAYEPVWAIGQEGTPADPGFANSQHRLIKKIGRDILGREFDVLYGGSVSLSNSRDMVRQPDIDGLFIGRSAWDAAGYIEIVEAVKEVL